MYHKLYDRRVKCISILAEMQIGDYLQMVEDVYRKTGGVEGQRGPLKTKTGITIRNRLVQDIQQGAVMPPVVIGVLLESSDYNRVDTVGSLKHFLEIALKQGPNQISVIDGMQRTTAMLDAVRSQPAIGTAPIRVEFWVSDRLNSLIYRMLVLNTGQVPWEIARQLETVYSQFLAQITRDLGQEVEIFLIDDQRRRFQAGQYQSRNIIELLLLFSSRKPELDTKDKVAEDFARLDAIETTSHSEFLDFFIGTLRLMAEMDKQFSRLIDGPPDNTRIRTGRDIFSSFPAMAGFCSSIAIDVFDEPGFDIDWDSAPEKMNAIEESTRKVIDQLAKMDIDELQKFMQLQLLEERLSQRSGQIGRFEREFFRRAFAAMFRNAHRLVDMTPCWMA